MTIVLAFDNDAAGERATMEAYLNLFFDSESEKGFLRAFLLDDKEYSEAVPLLNNTELAEELATWTKAGKPSGGPDWWYQMCEEFRTACLNEIGKRSRVINDQGGSQYIKAFNQANSISHILEAYGVRATPGRTTRCPMHDDSSPSLSISKDDGRAYCFNQACILWNEGHGVDPFALHKFLNG